MSDQLIRPTKEQLQTVANEMLDVAFSALAPLSGHDDEDVQARVIIAGAFRAMLDVERKHQKSIRDELKAQGKDGGYLYMFPIHIIATALVFLEEQDSRPSPYSRLARYIPDLCAVVAAMQFQSYAEAAISDYGYMEPFSYDLDKALLPSQP